MFLSYSFTVYFWRSCLLGPTVADNGNMYPRELSVARGRRVVLKSKVKDIQSMRRTQGEAADLKMEGATRRV